MPVMLSAWGVGLVKVTSRACEATPTAWNPKSMELVESSAAGARPLARSGTLWLPPNSLSWKTRFACTEPATDGAKLTST